MDRINIKKLRKIIRKTYFKNGQYILYDIPYKFNTKNGWVDWVDFNLVNKNGDFIIGFEVINYESNNEYKLIRSNEYFGKKVQFITEDYTIEHANKPLFMDNTFYLKQFTPITKKDIRNCVRYYICKILGLKMFFNFKEYVYKKEKNE